jgi:hypothetical protein
VQLGRRISARKEDVDGRETPLAKGVLNSGDKVNLAGFWCEDGTSS